MRHLFCNTVSHPCEWLVLRIFTSRHRCCSFSVSSGWERSESQFHSTKSQGPHFFHDSSGDASFLFRPGDVATCKPMITFDTRAKPRVTRQIKRKYITHLQKMLSEFTCDVGQSARKTRSLPHHSRVFGYKSSQIRYKSKHAALPTYGSHDLLHNLLRAWLCHYSEKCGY